VAADCPANLAPAGAQTLLGAARMVLKPACIPGTKGQRRQPGRTTIEGLHELEKAGVRGALINAVRAGPPKKSKRLAQA